jgi:uncharacterized protein (DUF1778 family)
MSVGELERPVAKKPDTTVRIDAETAELIRLAAAMKRTSIGEYLRSVVLPIARRDISVEAKKLAKGDKPE